MRGISRRRGQAVSFLPDAAVDAFALYGPFEVIVEQIRTVLGYGLPIEAIVPHPMPTPAPREDGGFDYAQAFAEAVFPAL